LGEYDQCGGKSKCTDYGCKDAAWPSTCCPIGTVCEKQDQFYWQCLDPILKQAQAAAADKGSSSISEASSATHDTGSDTTSTNGTSSTPTASDPESLQSTSGSRDSSLLRVARQPGSQVFLKANISTDYSKLAASPQEMARFKSSLVGWLKQEQWKPVDYYIDPKYVYDAGESLLQSEIAFVARSMVCDSHRRPF
jgi:hypothetical protein